MRPSLPIFAAVATVCVAAAPVWAQAPQQVAAPIVRSIDIQYAGPAAISKQRILANMRTQVGRPYADAVVEEDIRNLYATGNVSNVRIFGEALEDGVRVIVVIQSRSNVKEVRLEGVTQVKTKALRKKLTTKPGDQLSEANLETDRQAILTYYQDRGFKDTGVESLVAVDEKTGRTVVTFRIVESGRTIVRRIEFEGNESLKARELRKAVKTTTRSIISFITKSGRLRNEQLEEDMVALRDLYQSHGYIDVVVEEPQLERVDDKGTVDLIFRFREGAQYKVANVAVVGTEVLTPEEVTAALRLKPESIYSPQGVERDIKAIQDIYGSRGYIDVQILPEIVPAGTHSESITYRIEEGSQSYIQRVNISGNTRTKDKVIRRELAAGPGEVYNTVLVDASKQRLQNLNYFERVDIYPSDTLVPGRKDVNVIVTEKRTGSLNFGAGFSSVDSLIGFVELTQSNFDITNWPRFTGGGQRFRTRVQYGTQRKDFVVSLTEPYFLDYQLAVGGELFYHDADFLSTVYNQRNYGFSLFTRKGINQFMSWRLDYRLENIKIYDLASDVSEEIRKEEGAKWKSQVGPTLVYDSRDSVFLTRKGSRVEFASYIAGGPLGGDVQIYGLDLEATKYFLLPWDTILTLNGQVAVVDAWGGGSEVPIFDRLYLGGSNDLRGFNFRNVSPKDKNGDPIGGQTLARITVEYTFPVVDRVRGAVFYDAGIVNGGAYDFATTHLASDVGIGVRLDLPIGPVRIDYGIPMQKGYGSSSGGKFNFNIGYQF